ncbi:tetratricopeptide repeat protein [uncultured Dokdonia sp.]|uniref:tetratricopeptide repeat protein n=1 Tax=uncultured Dokdonia sp. TaxID=575653 RepID=UPI002621897F|nr:tetratricopeptide repeat protein [uncultured Dokdonia sp.]
MNDEELKNEAIERYLLMEMPPDERKSFEEKIAQNAELKEQVALYKALYATDDDSEEWITTEKNNELLKKEATLFRAQETKDFSKALKDYRAANTKTKRSFFTPQLWSAIAAVIIIGIFILYPKSPSLSKLYENYHNWEELPSYVSKGDDKALTLKNIETTFRSKNYQNVISISQTLDTSIYNTNPQISLYIGVSHLETNQHENAITAFDRLIQSNAIDFHKGYWYKALVFLKKGDKENTIKILETIVANPTYYNYEKAKELLDEIK